MGIFDFLRPKTAPILLDSGEKPAELSAKGLVKSGGLYEKERWAFRPDETVKLYKEIYRKDATVAAAIDLTVEFAVANGYTLRFPSGRDSKAERWYDFLRGLHIESWMEQALRVMLIEGDCYTEIVKNGGIDRLQILPSNTVDTNRDEHGVQPDDQAYVQVTKPGDEPTYFTKDEIIHLYRPYSSEPEGMSVLQPMAASIKSAWVLEDVLEKVSKRHAAPFIVIQAGDETHNPNDDVIAGLSAEMKKIDIDKSHYWVLPYFVDMKQLGSEAAVYNVQPHLDYFERRILAGLRAPSFLGKPEGGGRSVATTQLKAFVVHVKSLQRTLATAIEEQLFSQSGITGGVPRIEFNEIMSDNLDELVNRVTKLIGGEKYPAVISIGEARDLLPFVEGEIVPVPPTLPSAEEAPAEAPPPPAEE